MAAKYTKLLRSIWTNADFAALGAREQRMFLLLASQPDISACGVLPLMERRWGRFAADTDADSVRADLHALATCPQPFIVTDEGTDEVWVRSYLAVDELYRVPNGRKSIDAALSVVASSLLRPQIERVYRTLCGTVDEREPPRVGPPQQQAAASKHLTPDTSSSSPDPSDSMPAAAAAAIEIYVTHRLTTEPGVRTPTRYADKIRTDETRLHAHELSAVSPDADPVVLAMDLFGLSRTQALAAAGQSTAVPWCGPECDLCEGSAFVEADGGLAPCPNRSDP